MLYGETSKGEESMLRDLLASNDDLRSEFDQMESAFNTLNQVKMNPAESTIQNLLGYARNGVLRLSI